jgi:hypothetical protein
LLWNFANALKPPWLTRLKTRALIDIDPGLLQVSAQSWDMGQDSHDVFVTVGTLRTGWLSDRSACYLASGRPVLAEDTGVRHHYPTGAGLSCFRSLEEAAAGAAAIDADYRHHSRAARAFAEEFLDSRRSLSAMLAACLT